MKYICHLQSSRHFWQHHTRTVNILVSCTNQYFVSEESKNELLKQGGIERGHMRYLEKVDPELRCLMENKKGVPVYFSTIEYTFGLIHRTVEDIQEID